MERLKILDVTLRDGGCVNDFNFGIDYMNKILESLENSSIDYIELGYLDEKKGSIDNRTQFLNEKCIYQNFLINKQNNIKYVAMIDYGKFDVNKLEKRTPQGIDGIRFCFHKKDRFNILESCLKIIELGYECFIQPMLTMRYNNDELIDFISFINEKLPNIQGIYIVDSFGEMRNQDLLNKIQIFDTYLLDSITLGFHSHNNLQLSYSNAISFLNYPTKRNIMLDSSIMGMGKGAGNLNTELLLEHINLTKNKSYNISPLLEIIDTVVKPLHNEYHWGYSIEYYLSSINHCTPSYASHYYNKHMLPISKINELLSRLDENKKISFDRDYAEKIYKEYNEENLFDETETISKLSKLLSGKDVLIIGPGKSINDYSYEIISASKNKFIISLNFEVPFLKSNLILINRDEVYKKLKSNKNLLTSSNITTDNDLVINYKNWIEKYQGTIFDSSAVFALKLACFLKVNSITLAGLDGFSTNINSNYYNKNLRRGLSEVEVNKRNEFYTQFIKNIKKNIDVQFITPSIYNKE